jgi:ribosomal protein S16
VKAQAWLKRGARPSNTARVLLEKTGVLQRPGSPARS